MTEPSTLVWVSAPGRPEISKAEAGPYVTYSIIEGAHHEKYGRRWCWRWDVYVNSQFIDFRLTPTDAKACAQDHFNDWITPLLTTKEYEHVGTS